MIILIEKVYKNKMNKSLLLESSCIFDNSTLIDNIRQTYLDLQIESTEEIVEKYLKEAQKYLEKDLEDDVANELFQAILDCFTQFAEQLLPIFEDFLKKSKSNSNYIIITALVLTYLTHAQPKLTLPDYQPFVNECLTEILPQIQQKSECNLTLFGHPISPPFKIDLIVNLLLSSNQKSKLISKFFPFISSQDLIKTNPNLISLFEDISKSGSIQILPQTEESKQEIFDFITKQDIRLISKMNSASLSFIEIASFFIVGRRSEIIEKLQPDQIFPFLAILFIFIKKNKLEIHFKGTEIAGLILEGAKNLETVNTPLLRSSIDLIISNYTYLDKYMLLSFNEMLKVLSIFVQQLSNGKYIGDEMILLFSVFDLSHNPYYSFDIKYFFEKNGNELFIYVFRHLKDIINYDSYKEKLPFPNQSLDLDKIDPVHVTFQVVKLLKEDVVRALRYIGHFCTNKLDCQCLEKISEILLPVLEEKITEEKLDDILLIINFIENNFLTDILDKLKDMTMSDKLRETIYGFVPNKDINVDDLITHILYSRHPEKKESLFKLLFDKMMDDKEILKSYLGYCVSKYRKSTFSIDHFLNAFSNEYEKYQDDFMTTVNEQFYYNKQNNILIRNPNYKLSSLPISEFGVSIITRLFDEVEKKSANFQAFVCLKSIASTFPFLFLKDPQRIFDIVLPYLNNITLVYEKHLSEELNNLLKTSFSAMIFLQSTLQATKILDMFIKWIFTNIKTFSHQQIFCFIIVVLSTFSEHISFTNIPVWILKYNVFEGIGNLLEEINAKESFGFDFKESIYLFLKVCFNKLLKYRKSEIIQKEEFMKFEFPLNFAYESLFSTFAWEFKKIELFLYKKHPQFDTFMDDIQKCRDYWLSFNTLSDEKTEKIDQEKLGQFVSKLSKDYPLIASYKLPRIPKPLTVKMVRYLATKSSMVYLNILFSENIPMVQETFEMTSKIINELNEMSKDKSDTIDLDSFDSNEFLSKLYDQPSLFKNLIHQLTLIVFNDSYLTSIHDVFQAIADGKNGLHLILTLISQKLTDIYQKRLITDSDTSFNSMTRIIDDLSKFSKVNGFNDHFFEYCGNNLLEIVLSPEWRQNANLMAQVSQLFNSINKQKVPIRVTHFIGFLLILKDQESTNQAFKLCSKFESKELANIKPLILTAFDNELNKEKVTPELFQYIEECPMVGHLRSQKLYVILKDQLESYSKSTEKDLKQLSTICTLFNSLAPKRDDMTEDVSYLIDEKTKIPKSIIDTDPTFWSLYSEYKNMIDEIITKNPLLLDHFKFLLDFPEIVDFATRSMYFRMEKKVKDKSIFKTFTLRVDRNKLFESSFEGFQLLTIKELLQDFHVEFEGEKTIDELTTKIEWFTLLSKIIFNSENGLFYVTEKNKNLQPMMVLKIDEERLKYFRFIGQFVALALIDNYQIDAHFTSSFCKQILHLKPSLNDLEDVDENLYIDLLRILNNDVSSLDIPFSVEYQEDDGVTKTVLLKEKGNEVKLTNENKKEYVNLRTNLSLVRSIEKQVQAFCDGFDSFISPDELNIFTSNELNLLICGIPKIDVVDLKNNTVYESPYTENSDVVKFFFSAISKWKNYDLIKLVMFITGSSKIGNGGFKEFCERTGNPIKIQKAGEKVSMPQSHSCMNTLYLPQYHSEEELNEKLLFAIEQTDEF